MSGTDKTYLIAAAAGLVSLVAWIALLAVPAWRSYSRLWDRLLALALSAYVLVAFVLAGVGVGAAVLWYYDRL